MLGPEQLNEGKTRNSRTVHGLLLQPLPAVGCDGRMRHAVGATSHGTRLYTKGENKMMTTTHKNKDKPSFFSTPPVARRTRLA